ncbi:hypothetical protein [Teredinibacter purpureus]|uniref:hypothetical protein n=1 Tax=Teredinibacter purpureus TaxID=2731756 RepID=UPI0013C3FED6|nr:hypothetical protein [Teredinibacter purpureus]
MSYLYAARCGVWRDVDCSTIITLIALTVLLAKRVTLYSVKPVSIGRIRAVEREDGLRIDQGMSLI